MSLPSAFVGVSAPVSTDSSSHSTVKGEVHGSEMVLDLRVVYIGEAVVIVSRYAICKASPLK